MTAVDLPPQLFVPARPAIERLASAELLRTDKAEIANFLPGMAPVMQLRPGMGYPQYIGVGNSVKTSSDATVTFNANTRTGDLLLLAIQVDDNTDDSVDTPSGWTLKNRVADDIEIDVFWRFKDGSFSDVFIAEMVNTQLVAQVHTFRGVDPTTPLGASETGSSSGTSVTINGATTTVDKCLVWSMVGHQIQSNSAQVSNWSSPGLTNGQEIADLSTDLDWDGGFGIWIGERAIAGDIGDVTATLASSSSQVTLSFAIRPKRY